MAMQAIKKGNLDVFYANIGVFSIDPQKYIKHAFQPFSAEFLQIYNYILIQQ